MPRWLKIVLGIIAGLAIFAGAIVGVAFWLTASLVEPIDRQLDALKVGNFNAAYAETSEAFRQATSLQAFTEFVGANPILKDVTSHTFNDRSFENDVGKVTGTLTSSTGMVVPVTYRMVREEEVWKILHIQLGSSGEPSG